MRAKLIITPEWPQDQEALESWRANLQAGKHELFVEDHGENGLVLEIGPFNAFEMIRAADALGGLASASWDWSVIWDALNALGCEPLPDKARCRKIFQELGSRIAETARAHSMEDVVDLVNEEVECEERGESRYILG